MLYEREKWTWVNYCGWAKPVRRYKKQVKRILRALRRGGEYRGERGLQFKMAEDIIKDQLAALQRCGGQHG